MRDRRRADRLVDADDSGLSRMGSGDCVHVVGCNKSGSGCSMTGQKIDPRIEPMLNLWIGISAARVDWTPERCLKELLAAADGADPLRAAIPAIRADLKAANRALDLGQYVTADLDLLAIESRLSVLGGAA